MKKTLVTGGAGFIGSHLSDFLVAQDQKVVVLDNLSTGRMANIEHLMGHSCFEFVEGSILDESLMDDLVSSAGVVYHLAAAVGVQLIIDRPLESLTTNIRGSEIVFENALRYGSRVLVASTSEIYGKNTSDRLAEDDDRILGSPLKSRWSYSGAKAIDEILAHVYWRDRDLETVIVRLFNTVGPRQTGSYGMVVPRFVSQALRGEPVTVYGDGSQTRCFTHVSDVVAGMYALCNEPESFGQVFNLGGDFEVSISDLASRIIELSGSSSSMEFIPYDEAYEEGFEDMERRVPDITKASKLVGFKVSKDLDTIIRDVIDFAQGLADQD